MNNREGGRARAASVESEEEWTDSEAEEEWMEQAGCRLGPGASPQAAHSAGSWLQSSLDWVMLAAAGDGSEGMGGSARRACQVGSKGDTMHLTQG